MGKDEDWGTLKLLLLMASLIFAIPYWLFVTIFNNKLDFGTKLSYVLMSIPAAMLLFFVVFLDEMVGDAADESVADVDGIAVGGEHIVDVAVEVPLATPVDGAEA